MGLKVAMVSSWATRCGIFTYTQNLAKALANEGVEVYIVRLPRFGWKNQEVINDVAQRIPYDKVDCIHVQWEYGLFQGFEQGFYSILKAVGKPVITTAHAVGISWATDNIVASSSDRVVLHNEFCKRRFPYPNIVVIPHGAKPTGCPPKEKAKSELGLGSFPVVVGYLGFIGPYKGVEVLIEAMRDVKEVKLLIGGGWHTEDEPLYIQRLRDMSVKLLGNRVSWLGYVPDEKMSAVYACMDVFVYPSRMMTESGALLTALSHGKAVISSNLSPVKEKEKEGALLTFKNVKDLTRKIRHVLKDSELRERLEAGARQYCEKTSWSNVAKKHVALYEEVLKG